MINIKILGPGCPNCRRLETAVRQVVQAQAVEAQIEKVTDLEELMRYAILGMPGLVINEIVMAVGRIPPDKEIAAWLTQAASQR